MIKGSPDTGNRHTVQRCLMTCRGGVEARLDGHFDAGPWASSPHAVHVDTATVVKRIGGKTGAMMKYVDEKTCPNSLRHRYPRYVYFSRFPRAL